MGWILQGRCFTLDVAMLEKTTLFLLGILFALPLWALEGSFVPLTDKELSQYRFRLKEDFVLDYGKNGQFAAGIGGASIAPDHESDANFLVSGRDRAGKPWLVNLGRLHNATGWARVFTADLDKNGIRDAVIWQPNPGNGMAPSSSIRIITFEKNGRPLLFGDWGFYGVDEKGVEDLLDINRDGSAELLSMQFGYGYWINNLYQVKNARWQRVRGKFGRLRYPALTRFTHRRPNRSVVRKIIPERRRDVEIAMQSDLSNNKPCNNARYVLADRSGKRFREVRSGDLLETAAIWNIIDDGSEGRTINADADWEQIFREQRIILFCSVNDQRMENPHTMWILPAAISK
jgi:hypothetical protein